MLRAKNIWVVGGDPRQAALAGLLADDGHSVHTYALEQGEGMECEPSMAGADRADCVVLPLPAAGADGRLNAPLSAESHDLEEVLGALRPGQLVCAGMAGGRLERMAAERDLVLRDYFAREELAVLNAVPAALAVWQWWLIGGKCPGEGVPLGHSVLTKSCHITCLFLRFSFEAWPKSRCQ